MGQKPYFPPNVSGWEGGLSWLNTNTALARWGFVDPARDDRTEDRRRPQRDDAGRVRSGLRRGQLARGSPPGTHDQILAAAAKMPSKQPTQRLQRQQVLRTLMLAGPDAQVM